MSIPLASVFVSVPMISLMVGVLGGMAFGWSVRELRNKNLARIKENKRQEQLKKENQDRLTADYEEVVKMINGEVVPEWADYDNGTIGVRGSIPNPNFKRCISDTITDSSDTIDAGGND